MTRRLGRWSALAGLALALALPSAATSTSPGRNGLIAFVARSSHGWEPLGVAVIRPDGSGFRQVTRNRRDRSPAWSPDGTRLAFERWGAIFVIRADGTRLRRLTPRLRGGRQPAWSPDARQIAFTRKGALFVMRADGMRQRLLYHRRGVVANRPSWSPDGRRIAFGVTSESEEPGVFDYGSIVVIGSGGGGLRYVTDGRGEPEGDEPSEWAEDRGPDWSPDGRRILFTRRVWLCPRCDQDEIFSANWDGSGVVWVTQDIGNASEGTPSWSPDGLQFVAVTSDGLALFTVTGERLSLLPRPGSAPAWQPLRS